MHCHACVRWMPLLSLAFAGCPDGGPPAGHADAAAVADAAVDAAPVELDAASADHVPAPDAGALDLVPVVDGWSAPDRGSTADGTVADRPSADVAALDAGSATDAAPAVDAAGGPVTGCVRGSFAPYHGNLHAHTSASDGEGTFAEAFAYARDQGALDFFIVTDHLEQLYGLDGEPTDEWDTCWDEADLASVDGSYLALCGFEHGSAMSLSPLGPAGHVNVFFSDRLFPAIQLRLSELYASIAACPSCVTQFNHPLDEDSMTFDDFAHDAEVDARMNLIEFNTGADPWDTFHQALEAGWHVSPTWNQDNHSANWGTANSRRTGLFLATLSRDELARALRERRSFATADASASLRLLAGECWMGSIVEGVAQTVLRVEAADIDDGFDRIELHGPGPALFATIPCGGRLTCGGEQTLSIAQATYVVARAVQLDGDVLTSAPIWLSP